MRGHVKLRGVYGKPLIKPGGEIPMTPDLVKKAAEILLESVKEEIKYDMAKSSGMRGGSFPKPSQDRSPVPIPDSPKFIDSFSYVIKGKSTIEIVSSWPTADAHVGKVRPKDLDSPGGPKGSTPPFKIWWLTKPRVNAVPIITSDGEVIIRSTPEAGDAWVHPGFMRYSFIERGVRKGKERFVKEVLAKDIVSILMKDYNVFS
jgi:hypothetical protein